MLILNQCKSSILNMNNIMKIFISDGSIKALTKDYDALDLGFYKSDMRATEVLLELFKATDKYEMPLE